MKNFYKILISFLMVASVAYGETVTIGTNPKNSIANIVGGTITGITDLAIADGGTSSSTAATAVDALGGAASTGTGGLVRTTSPVLVTPTLGVAAATSINFGGGALGNFIPTTAFTCTVTLVGGAGNTTPVYTTNTCVYSRIGNDVFVDVTLAGDGGDEGAGTGVINVALPATAVATIADDYFHAGYGYNSTTEMIILGAINSPYTTIQLRYFTAIAATSGITGALQNNATRSIRLKFSYKI